MDGRESLTPVCLLDVSLFASLRLVASRTISLVLLESGVSLTIAVRYGLLQDFEFGASLRALTSG